MNIQEVKDAFQTEGVKVEMLDKSTIMARTSRNKCFLSTVRDDTVLSMHVYAHNRTRRFRTNLLGLHQAIEFALEA